MLFNKNIIVDMNEMMEEHSVIVLLNKGVNSIEKLHIDINEALLNKKYDDIEFCAHSISSISGTFGCEDLFKICREIEYLCIDGEFDEVINISKELDSLISKTIDEVKLYLSEF